MKASCLSSSSGADGRKKGNWACSFWQSKVYSILITCSNCTGHNVNSYSSHSAFLAVASPDSIFPWSAEVMSALLFQPLCPKSCLSQIWRLNFLQYFPHYEGVVIGNNSLGHISREGKINTENNFCMMTAYNFHSNMKDQRKYPTKCTLIQCSMTYCQSLSLNM